MKYVKMLGLAAVAGVALMAFVGTGSVSATMLCKTAGGGVTTGTICPSGKGYEVFTEVHAVNVGNVTFDTSFKTITCTSSTISGITSFEETPELVQGTLTFGGCNCTVDVIFKGNLQLNSILATHNATLKSTGTEVTTVCTVLGFPVHCTYVTFVTDIGTLTGGSDPTITVSAHIPVDETDSDGVCPEQSTWTATYTVTTPQPLFIAEHT